MALVAASTTADDRTLRTEAAERSGCGGAAAAAASAGRGRHGGTQGEGGVRGLVLTDGLQLPLEDGDAIGSADGGGISNAGDGTDVIEIAADSDPGKLAVAWSQRNGSKPGRPARCFGAWQAASENRPPRCW